MTSIAAYERELRAAQREADVEKVAALEASLVAVHKRAFPQVRRVELPDPDEVDPEPIRNRLEQDAGIAVLAAEAGGGEQAPVAEDPEPVDRYALMRKHRKKARQGISIFAVGDRVMAAREADQAADSAADVEVERRLEAQQVEQRRLDQLWARLAEARDSVVRRLSGEIEAEKQRRLTKRAEEQQLLDAEWQKLTANDSASTIAALERAFADNGSPAAPADCAGDLTTVVMRFSPPATVVPERKPALTPGGKPTLKKRTKTEINALYLEAMGSNVLATVKEAFATAPGTRVVRMLVIRPESEAKHGGESAPIYLGEFNREDYAAGLRSGDPGSALISAQEAMLNLKGQTGQVAPIDLSGRPDLRQALGQVAPSLLR
jgi:hypothetical protein